MPHHGAVKGAESPYPRNAASRATDARPWQSPGLGFLLSALRLGRLDWAPRKLSFSGGANRCGEPAGNKLRTLQQHILRPCDPGLGKTCGGAARDTR